MNKVHILGICGTFMGSLAILLKQAGWSVKGSDKNFYPPMSDLLLENNIEVLPEDTSIANSNNGLMVIGNALSRGNPLVEEILNKKIPFISGPELLYQQFLYNKHVIAISGTHGKTTTASLLAWILKSAGHDLGFLIGGRPANFPASAQIGKSKFFVIEADEYDTAFFDKRSKFIHYHPTDLLINNIEFDHADIFDDIKDIQKQFHHLVRTIPSNGTVVWNKSEATGQVINQGCWSKSICMGGEWQLDYKPNAPSEIYNENKIVGELNLPMLGEHNATNALACFILAKNIGIKTDDILSAIASFKGVARRQQLLHKSSVVFYDDFAHHPTAIEATIKSLKDSTGSKRIISLIHLSSNSMKSQAHAKELPKACEGADCVVIYQTEGKSLDSEMKKGCSSYLASYDNQEEVINSIQKIIKPNDCLVIMSNGDLKDIREKILEFLQEHHSL